LSKRRGKRTKTRRPFVQVWYPQLGSVYAGVGLGPDIMQLGQDDPWDRMEHIGVGMGGGAMTAGGKDETALSSAQGRLRLESHSSPRDLAEKSMVSYNLIAFFILLEDVTKCSISVASLHFREQACTRRTLAISRAPATMLVR